MILASSPRNHVQKHIKYAPNVSAIKSFAIVVTEAGEAIS